MKLWLAHTMLGIVIIELTLLLVMLVVFVATLHAAINTRYWASMLMRSVYKDRVRVKHQTLQRQQRVKGSLSCLC